MALLKKGKTNWKYILIMVVLTVIVGGGILGYRENFIKEIISLTQSPEIKKPRKIVEDDFPLTSHFVNEKDALLFRVIFDSLPPHLVIRDNEMLKEFIVTYLDSWIKNEEGSDYQVVIPGPRYSPDYYHPSIDDLCWTDVIIHEYAHVLDKIVTHIFKLARIETSDFYSISYYKPSQLYWSKQGRYDIIRPDNIANEFVTHYGAYGGQDVTGHRFLPWEDFAESFTMYVSQGVVFRELARQDPYVEQKYNFLKQVFQGKEYDSGDIRGIQAVREALSPYVVHATHPCDYTWRIPDAEWDYGF